MHYSETKLVDFWVLAFGVHRIGCLLTPRSCNFYSFSFNLVSERALSLLVQITDAAHRHHASHASHATAASALLLLTFEPDHLLFTGRQLEVGVVFSRRGEQAQLEFECHGHVLVALVLN